jgi:hypothetical protein
MPIIKTEKLNQVTQKWQEEEIEDSYFSPVPLSDIEEQINKACDDIVKISLIMSGNINKKIEKD